MTILRKQNLDKNPIVQFDRWFKEALESGETDPAVMNLATVGKDKKPSARMVLLKDFNQEGFQFFTNYKSRKGSELLENPYASLTFYWPLLERQIRIEGRISKLPDITSDTYFASRLRGSQISASISPQSAEFPNRQYLEKHHAEFEKK